MPADRTEARVHEVAQVRCVEFPKGSIVAVYRGYTDYKWYKTLSNKGIYFIARLKTNAATRVIERRAVGRSTGLTCDQTVSLAPCWLS